VSAAAQALLSSVPLHDDGGDDDDDQGGAAAAKKGGVVTSAGPAPRPARPPGTVRAAD
jgi:hypothetical protein